MALLNTRAPRHTGGPGRWLAAALLLLAAGLTGRAQADSSREAQIKAVFLFNFTQYIEWPAAAFTGVGAPFVIGVLGEDSLGPALDEAVRGETANGHPLVVRRFRHVAEVQDCHILFISRSQTGELEPTLSALRGRMLLTVSDADEFIERGGVIRFVTENRKIHLLINPSAAKAAHLTISAKLLRLAEIVERRKE